MHPVVYQDCGFTKLLIRPFNGDHGTLHRCTPGQRAHTYSTRKQPHALGHTVQCKCRWELYSMLQQINTHFKSFSVTFLKQKQSMASTIPRCIRNMITKHALYCDFSLLCHSFYLMIFWQNINGNYSVCPLIFYIFLLPTNQTMNEQYQHWMYPTNKYYACIKAWYILFLCDIELHFC